MLQPERPPADILLQSAVLPKGGMALGQPTEIQPVTREGMPLKCIYCLQFKAPEQFDRDHVMPALLGKFRKNLVLHRTVCAECNRTLGRETETVLGRGSFEGYVRYDQGIKGTKSAQNFMRDRVPIRVGRDIDGAGQYVDIAVERGKFRFRCLPQVSVQNASESKPRYLTEEEFLAAPEEAIAGCEIHLLTAEGSAEIDHLVSVVKQRIPTYEPPSPRTQRRPPPQVLEFDLRLDHALTRAFAKIGFNYLAHVAGRNFVLQAAFDPVRHFIRRGEGTPTDFVQVDNAPILVEEAADRRLQRHHLFAIQWEGKKRYGEDWIKARIAPFNLLTYHVRLCTGFTGIWLDINSGHAFDIDVREVRALRVYSQALLP